MDNGRAVTKQEFDAGISELATRLENVLQGVKSDLQAVKSELVERIADSQTEVLRGFYNWAPPLENRIRNAESMAMRLSAAEARLLLIEEKMFRDRHPS
jgi:hypothetical protein